MSRAIVLTACLMGFVGCNSNQTREPAPVTHKVQGKVVDAVGRAFALGGSIDFAHDSTPGVTTTGEISKSDGAFVLHSIAGGHKVAGARAGTYTVTISPLSQDQSAKSIQLRKKYVVATGDNNLTVQLED